MNLSNDLIAQFVRATKDTRKVSAESTVYGTTLIDDGKVYVQLDGSNQLTPVSTTTDVQSGERVTVMIKDHTAIITGNISSPAARTDDVKEIGNQITQVEILVADKVSTDELEAETARIDTLVSDNVVIKETLAANEAEIDELIAGNVTINETLTSQDAFIKKLDAEKLNANAADIKFATIESLEVIEGKFHALESTYGEFQELTATNFEAIDATIKNLNATYATITDLEVEKARIDDLEATYLTADSAEIKNLQADIAEIDTLIFGTASGTTIQASFANAVIAQLGNAQIKSAMIENISADKINAGTLNTNNVRVVSTDGRLVISDETIQISDAVRVRVQIGKDASGDYSINVWDVQGKLMFSEGGITDSAIKDAIIRNDMVAADANISASKLDISSLFKTINGSTETINAGRIYIDTEQQTLDIAFTTIENDFTRIDTVMSSHGTQISAIQGQIASRIWQQDIEITADELGKEIDTLNTQHSTIEQSVNSLSTTVSQHTSQLSDLENRVSTTETKITQTTDQIALMARKTDVEEMLDGYSTKEETEALLSVKADEITTKVSKTYATKDELSGIEIGARNLIRNSRTMIFADYYFGDPSQTGFNDIIEVFDGVMTINELEHTPVQYENELIIS